ncbi:MAG: zinc-ribbon domain-containing protein [Candidatus Thorarchaeota archaeon]
MIFDGIYDEMGHMMDWFKPNGIILYLGVIIFVIIVIILLLLLNRNSNSEVKLEDSSEDITLSRENRGNTQASTSNFCVECGSELDDHNSKFCPSCGTKL